MEKAIGMVEFSSISRGIYAADQMVKVSDAELATATSVCPGKYIAIVHGDVADVEESVQIGEDVGDAFVVDSILIPNVHPGVFPAIVGATLPEDIEALGILESYSLSAMVEAADRVLKCADLEGLELRLGTGLGGKSYFIYTGEVAAVHNGDDTGRESIGSKGLLLNSEVIPFPSKKLLDNLY